MADTIQYVTVQSFVVDLADGPAVRFFARVASPDGNELHHRITPAATEALMVRCGWDPDEASRWVTERCELRLREKGKPDG